MRRKQYIGWLAAVVGIFGTVYGAYLLYWHHSHGNGLNIPALIWLIVGIVCLIFAIVLFTVRYIASKKRKETTPSPSKEGKEEEDRREESQIRGSQFEEFQEEEVEFIRVPTRSYYDSYDAPTVYVKLIGEGPLLRIEGPRIHDMRDNAYYRIEGGKVNQEGYGPRFEIMGDRIRDAFGGYLYEISGDNINKVFSGFYASISGNYITVFDLSRKYEMTGSLSRKQILVVAALLFDR